jgi:membrane protein YqaA with SNARE-associated domain
MKTTEPGMLAPHLPDDIKVKRWIALYIVFLLAVAVPLAVLLAEHNWRWAGWKSWTEVEFPQMSPAIKLLVLVLYTAIACQLIPLPTGWVAAGVASQEAAVASGMVSGLLPQALLTALLVGLCGALGSTAANLNDYHVFTWMLRHRRIGAVRNTRSYQAAARWFSRRPFFLILVFNIIPIPVDFVRMLAITHRYPRAPFALANYVGRFLRFFVIAFVTFRWDLGKIAPISLLALALVLGAARLLPKAVRRIFATRMANAPA